MQSTKIVSVKVCLFLTLLMVVSPLVSAAPAITQLGNVRSPDIAIPIVDDKDFQIDPSTISPMAQCTPAASNWVISSGTQTCTGLTFSVQDYVTIQAGATLILEANSVLTLTSSYYYGGIQNYGTLKILNSTVKSASINYYQSIYFYGGYLRMEGATISNFYYGMQAWNGGKIQINATTFSSNFYYGAELSMVNGYITNSTFTNTQYYGLYISNLMNFKVNNNTFKNNMYGGMFYSYTGDLYDNTFQSNSQYGLYAYNSAPNMAHNHFISNGQAAVYTYGGTTAMVLLNCTFSNNGKDLWLESSGGSATVKAINTKINSATFDTWGGGASKLEVYWYTNISVKWEKDKSPVTDASLTIEDVKGSAYQGDLLTDANGEIKWLPLMEYVEMKAGKQTKSPYWVNATSEFEGRDIKNFSKMDVTQNGDNLAELILENIPPPVAITSPENNFLTNRTNVTISGVTEPNKDPSGRPVTVQVKIGGTSFSPVVTNSGGWEQIVPLPTEGNNNVDVTAYDWVFNSAKTKITIKRDTTNPPLTVIAPTNEYLTNQPSITVNGTTESLATVTVNGIKVTTEADGSWTTKVTLKEGTNTIKVKTMDAAQNWVQIERSVKLDTKAPNLMVADPPENPPLITNDKGLRISGITEAGARVLVNGNPVAISGTNFQYSFQLFEGVNILNFDAVDQAGNHNYTTRTVTLDTIPPRLEITSPVANNILTNKQEITITGYVDPGSKVLIGKEQKDFSGEWTYVLSLKEGKNKLTVEAIDTVGNKVILGRTIVRDTVPPVLAVFSPSDKKVVTDMNIMVEGSVEPGANLTINGKYTPTVGGVFSAQAQIVEGENTITLVATDLAGNTKTEIRDVTLDTIVNLVLNPDTQNLNGKQVSKNNLTVQGKTDVGAQVFINGEPVKVRADGSFIFPMTLMEGNNSIRVQAVDENTNTKTVEMWVVLKSPTNFGKFGNTAASATNIMIWVLVIALLIGTVGAIAGNSYMSKKKARDAEMKASQEAQTEAIKQDNPNAIYQSVYGGTQPQYPSAPVQPDGQIAYGTATAVMPGEASYAPAEITAKLDDIEAKIGQAETQGVSGVDARRNLRLARQFAARGNSDKADYYGEKALDSIGYRQDQA
jgi:uncharacterized protein YfaP (DUF2135 family)